jgi:hypothetical protein
MHVRWSIPEGSREENMICDLNHGHDNWTREKNSGDVATLVTR